MKRLILTICALAALSASAATRTWLADVNGDWNTPGMWSDGAVPGSGDTADFSNLTGDKTVNLPAAVTVAKVVYSPTVGATTNKLTLAGAALSLSAEVTVGEKAQMLTTCDVKATADLYTYGSGEWVVNCDAKVDDLCRDFADYNAGYRRFVREVRERHPGIYLEGCASGGLMMDIGWARDFDSFWLSDNQSPIYGMRIAKETMLRLPPQKIERWITARSAANMQPDYGGKDERLFVTEDALWRDMRFVAPDFVAAFASGGPVGFSCDLTALSEKHAEYFRRLVAERKKDAAFWGKAVGRILCDSPEVVVLQYSDAELKDVRVVVATGRSRQNKATVLAVLDPSLDYEHNGQRRKGAFWIEHGVAVGTGIFGAKELRFTAVAAGELSR